MLINCPKCGKPISDKAKICPHCNEEFHDVIKKESVQLRDYVNLSDLERKQLLEKFKKAEPKQAEGLARQEKTRKKSMYLLGFIMVLSFIMAIALFIVCLIVWETSFSFCFTVFLVVFIVPPSVFIISIIFKVQGNWYEELVSWKYHEEWLKKNNIVNFMLTFKNKEMENVYSQLKINDKGEVYNVNELS